MMKKVTASTHSSIAAEREGVKLNCHSPLSHVALGSCASSFPLKISSIVTFFLEARLSSSPVSRRFGQYYKSRLEKGRLSRQTAGQSLKWHLKGVYHFVISGISEARVNYHPSSEWGRISSSFTFKGTHTQKRSVFAHTQKGANLTCNNKWSWGYFELKFLILIQGTPIKSHPVKIGIICHI